MNAGTATSQTVCKVRERRKEPRLDMPQPATPRLRASSLERLKVFADGPLSFSYICEVIRRDLLARYPALNDSQEILSEEVWCRSSIVFEHRLLEAGLGLPLGDEQDFKIGGTD